MRKYWVGRDVKAACYVCHGDEAYWTGKNAQAVAAKHHDSTGHSTWVEVYMSISYGKRPEKVETKKAEQEG